MRSELLGNVAIKIGSGATPKGGDSAYQDEGISFIRSQNVLDHEFNKNGLAFINSDQAKKLNNVTVESKDILLNITGDSIARACMVPDHILPARVNQHVSIIRCKQEYDPKYILYYLIYLKPYLLKICGVGGTRNALTKDVISNLPIKVQNQQFQIAKILSDLDSKIELNNKINAELEAMAKLIYDYWFVQFDFPNAKGKPYKTSGGKMVWSEELKREVPEGWEVKKIEDYADFKNGKGLSKEEISEKGKYDVFGSNGVIGKTDNILFAEPVIAIGRVGAYYGEVNYSLDNCWISDNAVTSQPLIRENFWWLLLTLKGINYENIAGGSAQPLITQGQLRQLKFAVPGASIFYNYHQKVNSSYQQIHNNNKQNQKLSELRDWLLPMLMNGQVTIKASANKVKPVVTKPFKPANTYFHQTQVLGAIINASKQQGIKHGEMTLAKYSYLVDRLYNIPTSFKYDRWHLGPYPTEMKKVVNNKQFFKIQNNEVRVVPQKKEYNFHFQQQVEEAVAELASIFNQYKGKNRSHQTELLATVCKVVEDIQSTDLEAVRESMKKWPIELKGEKFKNKAEKFGEEETEAIISVVIGKGWDRILIRF